MFDSCPQGLKQETIWSHTFIWTLLLNRSLLRDAVCLQSPWQLSLLPHKVVRKTLRAKMHQGKQEHNSKLPASSRLALESSLSALLLMTAKVQLPPWGCCWARNILAVSTVKILKGRLFFGSQRVLIMKTAQPTSLGAQTAASSSWEQHRVSRFEHTTTSEKEKKKH